MGKPAMRSRPVVLAINGELVAVPPGCDLSQSLVEFIRTQTRFTVRKRLPQHEGIDAEPSRNVAAPSDGHE